MNLNSKPIARYNLAGALPRIFTRFFDLLIIVQVVIGICFALFFGIEEIYGWKIFVLSLIIFLLFFIQFIAVPFFANGYTLFSKMFKIKIYSITLKNIFYNKKDFKYDNKFFLQLIKRELFLWIIPVTLFLIFGFFCLQSTTIDISSQLYSIIRSEFQNDFIIISGFIILSAISVSLVCPLILIMNIIIMSKKRTFHDYFSNTVVIKMIDVNGDDPKNNKNIKQIKPSLKYGLPGEIDVETIKEIGE